MNHEKELLKNTLILSIGQLVPKILGMLTLPILTAHLSADEYGKYDLVISLSGFLMPFITLQIHQAVFRELLTCTDIERKKNIRKTVDFFFAIISFIWIVILSVYLWNRGILLANIAIVALYIVCESMYILTGQEIRGIGKNLGYSKGTIIYAITNLVLLVIFWCLNALNSNAVIFSMGMGYLVAVVYYKVILNFAGVKIIDAKVKWNELKPMLSFSIPIVPSAVALWGVNLSDRLVVTAYLGISANGIYSVANKIPNIYNSAYSIFNMAWIESATRIMDEGDYEQYYTDLFKKLFDFLTGVMLIMVAALPVLFKLLINQEYSEAYNHIILLFWGAYFNSFVSFYGGIYIALKRTKSAAISSIAGALLNLLINFIFINKIGLYAASLSTAIAFGIIALYRAVEMRRYISIVHFAKKIFFSICIFAITSILAFQEKTIFDIIVCFIAVIFNWSNRYLYKELIGKIFKKA